MIQKEMNRSLSIVLHLLHLPKLIAMPTATKKSTTRSAKAKTAAAAANAKHHAATHPPWIDMIKVSAVSLVVPGIPFPVLKRAQECIVSHPGDTRTGVSRPTIKKVSDLLRGLTSCHYHRPSAFPHVFVPLVRRKQVSH